MFKSLLWNSLAKWDQNLLEWSLGGPFQNFIQWIIDRADEFLERAQIWTVKRYSVAGILN